MNTHTQPITTTPTAAAPNWPVAAAIGAGTATVLTAVGTFWDITGDESGDRTMTDFWGYLSVNLGMIVVGTAIVFGLVVRPATAANAGRRGLVLAVVGLLSVAVFWTGLPAILAAGATACALVDRRTGSFSRLSQSALAISVVTLGLAVWLAIAG